METLRTKRAELKTKREKLTEPDNAAPAKVADQASPDPATEAVKAGENLSKVWLQRAFDLSIAAVLGAGGAGVLVGLLRSRDHVRVKPSCTKDCSTTVHIVLSDERFALVYASALTALFLVLLACFFAGRNSGGLVGLVIGDDNRVSTSKTQVGLWTIAVVFAFVFFTFEFFKSGTTEGFKSLDANYLLLLGGPFAAAVLASATTTTKVHEGTAQKAKAASPAVSDITKSDNGRVSISDTQFLLFNLVALTYFVIALVKEPSKLPDIPDTLVGLTSVSALTYLGAKVVSSSQAIINSVSIVRGGLFGKITHNSEIRILGQNFETTPDQPERKRLMTVLFDGVEAHEIIHRSDTEVRVKVPNLGVRDSAVDIIVRTTAGVETAPYKTLVYKNKPAP